MTSGSMAGVLERLSDLGWGECAVGRWEAGLYDARP
jgi:hypothetical protein